MMDDRQWLECFLMPTIVARAYAEAERRTVRRCIEIGENDKSCKSGQSVTTEEKAKDRESLR